MPTPTLVRDALYQRFQSRIVHNPALDRTVVSFQANKQTPFYSWFKYREGFSRRLVDYLLETIGAKPGILLDPFAGGGSALLFADSKPARVVFHLLATSTLLTSLAALQELETVLHRKKFNRYVTLKEREALITRFALTALVIDIDEAIQVCRDPKDDKFLEIAVNGEADVIITGDPDLLVLHPFRGTAVLTPDAVLNELSLAT